jgi:glycosyltransferase involved in cell wall biosynthesis
MHTVFVYRADLLPYSETFIKEQLLAYRKWRGVLIGERLIHQLSLDGLDVRILNKDQQSLAARVIAKLRRTPANLAGILREQQPKLLHAHFGPDALGAHAIARALDVPMIVTLHGYDINIHREWWENGNAGNYMKHYPRRLLKLAARSDTHFIAVSNTVKQQALAFGIPPDKLTTCYIGIDVSKFTPSPIPLRERPLRVLFVGRLVEKKGCEYLIRAMKLVKSEVPTVEVRIIGDGPLRPTLSALAEQSGIVATFKGVRTSNEVQQELSKARIYCLPSITAENGDAEGLPISILEAQACGVPVVTSARGGASESIEDGGSGFSVPEKDIQKLASKIIQLLRNEDLATAMASRGPRFIQERFDNRKHGEILENLYNVVARLTPAT